jgi:FkbM family methyltransferase
VTAAQLIGIYEAYAKTWPDFEELIRRVTRAMVLPGDCVVDGGANIGEVTEFLANLVAPSGTVISFEPAPEVYAHLIARVETRALTGIVRPYQLALADRAGESSFAFVPQLHGYSGLRVRDYPVEVEIQRIVVSTVCLDQFRPLPGELTFIKLDLEGGEFHALRGGEHVLRQYRPFLVFEHGGVPTCRRYGYDGRELTSFLHGLGYVLFDIVGNEIGDATILDRGIEVYYYFAGHPAHARYSRFRTLMSDLARSVSGS